MTHESLGFPLHFSQELVEISSACPYFAGPVQAQLHVFLPAPGPLAGLGSSRLPGDEAIRHQLDPVHHLPALQCDGAGNTSATTFAACRVCHFLLFTVLSADLNSVNFRNLEMLIFPNVLYFSSDSY